MPEQSPTRQKPETDPQTGRFTPSAGANPAKQGRPHQIPLAQRARETAESLRSASWAMGLPGAGDPPEDAGWARSTSPTTAARMLGDLAAQVEALQGAQIDRNNDHIARVQTRAAEMERYAAAAEERADDAMRRAAAFERQAARATPWTLALATFGLSAGSATSIVAISAHGLAVSPWATLPFLFTVFACRTALVLANTPPQPIVHTRTRDSDTGRVITGARVGHFAHVQFREGDLKIKLGDCEIWPDYDTHTLTVTQQ